MNSIQAMHEKLKKFNGNKISEADVRELRRQLPDVVTPVWLMSILENYPISGACFSLDEGKDKSGFGVEARWLMPNEIVEEALLAYPGKLVIELGYLPFGSCLIGSGDPYFIKVSGGVNDSSVVRIPHDFATKDGKYPEDKIEMVCPSVYDFILNAAAE